MEEPFKITKERVAETVKKMAVLMDCDHRTAYEKYCHDIVKMAATWEDIEPLLTEDLEVKNIMIVCDAEECIHNNDGNCQCRNIYISTDEGCPECQEYEKR